MDHTQPWRYDFSNLISVSEYSLVGLRSQCLAFRPKKPQINARSCKLTPSLVWSVKVFSTMANKAERIEQNCQKAMYARLADATARSSVMNAIAAISTLIHNGRFCQA